MKKVKAMLAGIAVLAVVGGAFAFKAKNAFSANVFYTTAATYVGVSPSISGSKTTGTGVGKFYYTTAADATTAFPTSTTITSPEL